MSSNGILWLLISNDFSDLDRTNFVKFYGGFKEVGLLNVVSVFRWLYEFGLDVLLRIEVKIGTNFSMCLIIL
jgi:hypothetical protein